MLVNIFLVLLFTFIGCFGVFFAYLHISSKGCFDFWEHFPVVYGLNFLAVLAFFGVLDLLPLELLMSEPNSNLITVLLLSLPAVLTFLDWVALEHWLRFD